MKEKKSTDLWAKVFCGILGISIILGSFFTLKIFHKIKYLHEEIQSMDTLFEQLEHLKSTE